METPHRLFDESEGPLRDAIEAAREDLPDEEQIASLATKLGPLLGGGPGGGGGAGAGGAGGGAGVGGVGIGAAKIAGALLAAAGVAAVLVYAGRSTEPRDAPATVEAVPDAAAGSVSSGTVVTAAIDAGVDAGQEGPPATRATRARSPEERAARPDDVEPPRAGAAEERAPGPDEPQAEIELLRRAQDALASAPAEALRLVGDHARAYPDGMLAQEREVIGIDALLRLGRRAQAETRAEAFRARWPRSAQVRRVDALLARR